MVYCQIDCGFYFSAPFLPRNLDFILTLPRYLFNVGFILLPWYLFSMGFILLPWYLFSVGFIFLPWYLFSVGFILLPWYLVHSAWVLFPYLGIYSAWVYSLTLVFIQRGFIPSPCYYFYFRLGFILATVLIV